MFSRVETFLEESTLETDLKTSTSLFVSDINCLFCTHFSQFYHIIAKNKIQEFPSKVSSKLIFDLNYILIQLIKLS